MQLPNGKVVDVLSSVLEEIEKWIQDASNKPESGGYIIGYQHKATGNYSLEAVSPPYSMDIRTSVRFDIRDPKHQDFLYCARHRKSYYLGVWHTHPQTIPIPSNTDWTDWRETLILDKTGCQYVFFIIAGTIEWRLWVGEFATGRIQEVYECKKSEDGMCTQDREES